MVISWGGEGGGDGENLLDGENDGERSEDAAPGAEDRVQPVVEWKRKTYTPWPAYIISIHSGNIYFSFSHALPTSLPWVGVRRSLGLNLDLFNH